MVATASAENSSLRIRSETMTGRTVCSKWARTGPWGSRLEGSSGSTRQLRLYGSVRGALGNWGPYRNTSRCDPKYGHCLVFALAIRNRIVGRRMKPDFTQPKDLRRVRRNR
jgi:hypothetical protein